MRESGIKTAIVHALRRAGYYARRMPQDILTGGGMPDIYVQLKKPAGRACWLEVKQPGGHPTPLQRATMEEITRHGGACAVVHSVQEAMQAVLDHEGTP